MKRKSKEFPVKKFIAENPELSESKVEIRIDDENEGDILNFLFEKNRDGKIIRKKKFTRILYEALKGRYNESLYDREEVSSKAKDVTAMKFIGKYNFRIVCKEINCGHKKIIMVVHFHKKNQKNSKRDTTIYETVGGYDYEC